MGDHQVCVSVGELLGELTGDWAELLNELRLRCKIILTLSLKNEISDAPKRLVCATCVELPPGGAPEVVL